MKAQKRSVQVNAESDSDLDVTPGAPDVTETKPEPTHEEISVLAHQIYEEEGCPSGLAEAHWEAAERSLHRESLNACR